jgi:hypothetical protein
VSLWASLKSAAGVRGLGCNPDPIDARDHVFSELTLGVTVPPPSADLSEFIPSIIDQSGNSCVGAAIAQAIRMQFLADGWGAKSYLPSRHAIYYWALAFSGMQNQDSGTFIRDGIRTCVKFGIPPESAWPSKSSTLMRAPNITAFRAAADSRKLAGYYRIAKGDTNSMRLAIASGNPVVIGLQVGRSFVDGSTSTIDRDSGKELGGHAGALIGFESDRFLYVSSWGPQWSRNGLAWLSERRVREGFDLWVIDLLSR